MKFYISDTHFEHKNVLKFDHRPFFTIEEMAKEMINNWNKAVKKSDEVYILGDFCWSGKKEVWQYYLDSLTGRKHLILGNHDFTKMPKQLEHYFESVSNLKEIKDEGRNVILCHYPIPFYRSSYNPNIYMLYGHVHTTREEGMMMGLRRFLRETSVQAETFNRGNIYPVGCMLPHMNYTPQTLDSIIANYKEIYNENT